MYGIFILCARSAGYSWLRHGPFVATFVPFALWSRFLFGWDLFVFPPTSLLRPGVFLFDWFILPRAFASGMSHASLFEAPIVLHTSRRGPAPLAIWIALAG